MTAPRLDPKDAARVTKRMDSLAREFDGRGMKDTLTRLGREAARDADTTVAATIGDLSMSGWTRRNPIPILTRSSVKGSTVTVLPRGRATGPMRVLEDGREARSAGDTRERSRYSKKSGGVSIYRSRVKRTVGAMPGKQVWSKAQAKMAITVDRGMKAATSAKVQRVMGR